MRKYLAFYKANILNTLTYRGPIVVWLSSNFITLITVIAAWFAVSASGLIGGYTKSELITYYIFALLLQWLTGWFPFYWIKDDIATGDIVGNTLLKPLSLYLKAFAQESGWHSVSIFIGIFAAAIVALPLHNYFVFNLSVTSTILVLLAIAGAIMLTFTFSMCLTMICFWTIRVGPLDALFWMGESLLGGQSIPISFFPFPARLVVEALPFRYMFSFPIEIYLGKLPTIDILHGFVVAMLWWLVLYFLFRWLWAHGRLAYTSFGQ